jgi:DNA-binding NarL/FixJ family response regulator
VVVFLTGYATVELAVQVMKDLGALTCLRKETFRRAEFRAVINEALSKAADGVQEDYKTEVMRPPAIEIISTGSTTEGEAANRRVLVVEDDAGWRELLTQLLNEKGYFARSCGSYVEAIGLLKRDEYQAAVVDLSLASSISEENRDGYRLLTGMRKSGIPVIVVSGYAEPARIEQAYQEQFIIACLEKQAFDRKGFLHIINEACNNVEMDPVLKSLTEREREVLVLLAEGLTNKEIARELTITQNTVKRHLKSLFAKLGVSTRSAASAKAINLGVRKVS